MGSTISRVSHIYICIQGYCNAASIPKKKSRNTNNTLNKKEMGGCLITDSSSGLAGRLVKPGPDIVLPVLFEMTIRNHIVMLHCLPVYIYTYIRRIK